jgi:hypothetical protein
MLFSLRRAPGRVLVAAALSVLCITLLPLALAASAGAVHQKRHAAAQRSGPVSPALRAASRTANRADRRLVAQARALRACLRGGSSCPTLRRKVQRSGRAFTAAQRRLSATARRRGRRGAVSSDYGAPPVLHASGYKLGWTRSRHAGGYVIVAMVPGQGNRYSLVRGTSASPPPVPGLTVTYLVRTAARSSRWSNPVKITYPAAPPPPIPTPPAGPPVEELNLRAAPALHVAGQTLTWNLVAGVSAYILMTKVPGQPEAFTAVSGTSTTPPAVPGKTVSYSVRTAVDGSAWAPNVTITYPATPSPKPPPPGEPSGGFIGSTGFQPGINSGTNPQDYTGSTMLGAKIVRISVPIGAPASAWESIVSGYAARGIRVAPLASFYGRLPSPAEAQGLGSWAKAFGPGGTFWAKRSDGNLAFQTIEFGNETSYGYQFGDNAGTPSYQARAQGYAARLKEAAEAVNASGVRVGVLAVADDPSGNWMNGMFQAVPNLGSYVGGWVTHPYGTSGKGKLLGVIAQAAAHGAPANIPLDITEWGISTDAGHCVYENYGFNPCMSYQEAAEQLKRSVAEIKTLGGSRLRLFILYQIRDQQLVGASSDREAYFGLLQNGLQPKGAYTTAAQELLAL